MDELTQHVPDNAIVVVDTGHAGMWMGGMYDLRAPKQSYIRSAGHLGWAFPAGIGAKAACPDRPVVVFTGDAGFWYHIGEIETAVRWKINSITVVNNNGGGNQTKRGFDRAYGGKQTEQARELWTYKRDEFRQASPKTWARSASAWRGRPISRPALRTALAANRPAVIDVATDIDALAPTAVSLKLAGNQKRSGNEKVPNALLGVRRWPDICRSICRAVRRKILVRVRRFVKIYPPFRGGF